MHLEHGFWISGAMTLDNLEKYCSDFLEAKVIKIDENNKTKENNSSDLNLNSCMGAIKIIKDGWETEAIPEPVDKRSQKLGFFSKFFGNRP